MAISVVCPECGSTVELKKRPHIGDLVYCPECDEDYEVVRLNPVIELDWPWDEDEWDDWED